VTNPLTEAIDKDSLPPLLLVVDDREENLEAMQALLGDDDYWRLHCVDSGEKALHYLLHEDVSLVLLDVQMPGMDGYEVAERIRANPKTHHMPIIFVSATAQTQAAILRGYDRGAIDFIIKPFDPLVLSQKIHNLLEFENNRRALLRLNQRLERERSFNESILTNAAEGIMVVGEDGVIGYANPTMAQMLASHVQELKGRRFLTLFKTSETKKAFNKSQDASDNECVTKGQEAHRQERWENSPFYRAWQKRQIYRLPETTLCRQNGYPLPVSLSCAPLPSSQKAMVVMVRDIATEQELRQNLEALTVIDPLTHLLNRRGFYQAANSVLARARRDDHHFSILYLDLDGFKKVNDLLGHDVGDSLLRHIAAQLKAALRPYDMLARMGGDEFTILLDGLKSCRDAGQIANKLIQIISKPHQIEGENITVSASIGIACYPEMGENIETLLQASDMAMYEAKKNSRQHYRFHSPQMTKRAIAKLEIEQRLRQAIDEQHFTLAYQPQFYLNTGRLRGFEVLLRWPQNKTAGNGEQLLPPDQLIRHLEEIRLIQPLWQWILHESLSHLHGFQHLYGDKLVLSLNVSPGQFVKEQMVDDLAKYLEEKDISAHQLELEVTEGTLLQDLDVTQTHLRHLRELGISVAIDDFGTGYSSLAYLRQFDVDILKIDRLFIANMLTSHRDAAVVSTILDLSRHLGLQVIAEGVETQAQRQWLSRHHCAIMQGYLVAPALPFEMASQMLPIINWENPPPGGGVIKQDPTSMM